MSSFQTPLYEEHLKLGGKMVDFAGWMMPLWYATGQSAEHHATRHHCGLFDICHMGEFSISGSGSREFLSKMLSNNVETIAVGQARYHFMLNESGGVIDDCLLYHLEENDWMLVVNAANKDIDLKWLHSHVPESVQIQDISEDTVKIDLQGPKAPELLTQWISAEDLAQLKFFRFLQEVQLGNIPVLLSRTGYTGEIGFEIYTKKEYGVELWQLLLEQGKAYGILPCGLGARDTLRVEAGLPLHGHELTADLPAIGHPWMFTIDWEHDFIGKTALLKVKEDIQHYVVAFKIEGRRKAMPGWQIRKENKTIGKVLSGVTSPTLENTPIGFAASDRMLEEGTEIDFFEPERNICLKGVVVNIPFVSLTSRKKMRNFLNLET